MSWVLHGTVWLRICWKWFRISTISVSEIQVIFHIKLMHSYLINGQLNVIFIAKDDLGQILMNFWKIWIRKLIREDWKVFLSEWLCIHCFKQQSGCQKFPLSCPFLFFKYSQVPIKQVGPNKRVGLKMKKKNSAK